jgi:hypothetical protein
VITLMLVLIALTRALYRPITGADENYATAMGAAWAWGLLSLTLLAPVFFPWYLAWLLPIAWLLPARAIRFVVALSVIQAISMFAVEDALPHALLNAQIAAWILAPLVLVLSILIAKELVGGLKSGESLAFGP